MQIRVAAMFASNPWCVACFRGFIVGGVDTSRGALLALQAKNTKGALRKTGILAAIEKRLAGDKEGSGS